MTKAEDILLFDIVFSILLFSFGATTGTVNLTAFQSVQAPTLTPPGSVNLHCGVLDFQCQAVQGIAIATSYIGFALFGLGGIVVFLVTIFVLFGNSILAITFQSTFTGGIPLLGVFYVGLNLYVIWEVFRLIRGTSVGV